MANLEPLTRYLPAPLRERLEGRPNLWRILTNVAWLFGDRILRLGVGLLIGVWVARYLGPNQFGLLNYAIAFAGLFLPLAMLGLDTVAVRDLVQEPSGSKETLGTAFALKLVAGVTTYALVVIAVMIIKPGDAFFQLVVILAGTTLVFQAFEVVDFWFQSQVKAKYTVIARNTSFLVMSVARLVLILSAAPLIAFAAVVAIEGMLTAIGLLLIYQFSGERFRAWRVSRTRAVELLRMSWPLILTTIAITVYMRIDQVMLGELRGDTEVGVYAAALRLSEVWYVIPGAVVTSVAPAIARAKKSDPVLYERRVQQLLTVMALAGYAVALPITLLSGPIIDLLFGPGFSRAAPTLAIHIWAGVFVNLGGAHSLWLLNEGRTGYFSVSTAIGAVINVVLNLWLIPQYGAVGAAIATLVSYGFTVSVVSLLYKPTRPLGKMIVRALFLRH